MRRTTRSAPTPSTTPRRVAAQSRFASSSQTPTDRVSSSRVTKRRKVADSESESQSDFESLSASSSPSASPSHQKKVSKNLKSSSSKSKTSLLPESGLRDDLHPGLIDTMASHLRPLGDRAMAVKREKYMRNLFPHLGMETPVLRESAAPIYRQFRKPANQRELEDVCWAFWEQPEREFQWLTTSYLRSHLALADASFIDFLEKLITTKSWWDTNDMLGVNSVGYLVKKYPELHARMEDWLVSPNLWLARTSILHMNTWKADTDAAFLFRACLTRCDEKDFFMRKCIGWALREYSKTDANAVRQFIKDHHDKLSTLSRTEGMKWIVRKKL